MSVLSKERLTERHGELAYCPQNIKCTSKCDDCDHMGKMMDKLAEYEDLEEQGLLLRLPCHCKDCKHVDYVGCAGTTCYCMKISTFMQEDDFCKYAVKDEAKEKLRELNKESEE